MNYYNVCIISHKLDRFFAYQSHDEIELLSVVEVVFKNRLKTALVIEKLPKPSFECLEIQDKTALHLPPKNYSVAKFMSEYYICSLGEVLGIFHFFTTTKSPQPLTIESPPVLSSAQEQALAFCKSHPYTLLFGDTGSGKTEIYIKAMCEALENGKSAILLMPEISLTPQMEIRLRNYFGDKLAIWHSKLSKKKKQTILEQIALGEIRIVAGARSALFLPITSLGLIIVDEEHDDAYKAMNTPFYHARDMAVYFGKIFECKVILGSATPALTSYYKYPFFRLRGGYFEAQKNFVFCKDSIDESEYILNEIKHNYEQHKQTIVFVPTKANFQYLICKQCGEVTSCPYCSISLSLYTKQNKLVCHYCNYTKGVISQCPSCKSGELSSKKMGTSQVATIVKAFIPEAVTEQFDRSEVTTDTKLKSILKNFNDKKIDILIGTQMISKGHDYHNAALAVILNIDSILYLQDYRAREKALSLFLQIAGRVGRKEAGKVITQTRNEDFFRTFSGDYEEFMRDEAPFRQDMYPPYRKLARVSFVAKKENEAYEGMQKMQQLLLAVDDIEVVGSGKSPIFKIASKFRYFILVRTSKISTLLQALYKTKNKDAIIDVEPTNFV